MNTLFYFPSAVMHPCYDNHLLHETREVLRKVRCKHRAIASNNRRWPPRTLPGVIQICHMSRQSVTLLLHLSVDAATVYNNFCCCCCLAPLRYLHQKQFIRYLLGRDFPGQRIGPEPTTDRFVAVMDGADERVVPGNALTVSPNLPYRGLDRFGVSFLNKFEASQLPSPVLRNITIVDTPGEPSAVVEQIYLVVVYHTEYW